MEIRPVTENDVEQVLDLVSKTLNEFGIQFGQGSATDEQLSLLPASYVDHGGTFFVAENAEKIVGTAGIFPVAEGVFELRKMYLGPETRGHGIGQKLLSTCLNTAKNLGANRIVLDTTEQMTSAIHLYEKNGFVRDDTYRVSPRCTRGYRLDL